MEAELSHADGRTDMTKLIVAFLNFANVSNKILIMSVLCGNNIGVYACESYP